MEAPKKSKHGLVLGICAFVMHMVLYPLTPIFWIPGIILSLRELKSEKKVVPVIGLLLNLLVMVWWIVMYAIPIIAVLL